MAMFRSFAALCVLSTLVTTAADARQLMDRSEKIEAFVRRLEISLDEESERLNAITRATDARVVALRKQLEALAKANADKISHLQKQLETMAKLHAAQVDTLQNALAATVKLDGVYTFKASSATNQQGGCLATENVLEASGMNDRLFTTLCDSGLMANYKNWVIQSPRTEPLSSNTAIVTTDPK
jgi:hypothetical protein